LVAKFKYNEKQLYLSQGETLKPQEDGIKKVGEQNKAGINLKIQNPSLQAISVQHLCTEDQQEEKSIRSYLQGEENNKRYQENPQLYKQRQELKRSGNHENK
jgi:hypothetical protein